MEAVMVVFEVENMSATARDAAQAFAETFKPARVVVWHINGDFHFEGGLKTYSITPTPHGWKIKDSLTL
jgi:hypothetical protein